jgi:hypothetical protein
MARIPLYSICLALVLAGRALPTFAATVDVQISDTNGRPATNAVVSLMPESIAPKVESRLPIEIAIDQRKETFIPLVSIVRKGGRAIFTNNDTTMHQVYSFSPIKQFAFEIDQGHRSEPLVFDKAGVASIGCNIHDHMITYVFVAATPWAVLTAVTGRATIDDVPAGNYRVEVWHPQLQPGRPTPSALLNVGGGNAKFSLAVPLLPAPSQKHMHMGSY